MAEMLNTYALGNVKVKFEDLQVPGEEILIEETFEEDDTQLTSNVDIFEIKVDQKAGPVSATVSDIVTELVFSMPYNPEIASKLDSTWTAGVKGYALGGIGKTLKRFKATIIPVGLTETDANAIILKDVGVSVSTELSFKKQGLAKMMVTVKAASDKDGVVLQTGDYTLVAAPEEE
ncbi:MAG: hypothetical protein ACRCZH_03720 [Cetobacterium sp.]